MKTAVSFFEQNGGTYTRVGDALLPNLALDKTESKPIGKYGRIRRRYLKEHRPAVYSLLPLNGELDGHLAEIDQTCEERIEQLDRQMAEREGMTDPCACRAISAPMCSASGRRFIRDERNIEWILIRFTVNRISGNKKSRFHDLHGTWKRPFGRGECLNGGGSCQHHPNI